MKKAIIAIVAVAVVIAAAAGVYFAFFAETNENTINVTVVRDDFVTNEPLLAALIMNPDRYESALATEYGLGAEKAAEFYEAPEDWLTYEQIINITNNSEEVITVYGFEVKNNGKNGVYINTNIGGELSISPNGSGPASFSILCDNGDLSTEEAKALVDKMEISLVYSKTPVEYDDGTESVEETQIALIEAPVVK